MPKSFYACLSAVLVLVMLAFAYGEADAARIGGGRSFGGRPSMSQPYTKPLPSNPSSSFNQQPNRQSQQMANSAAPSRGLFGGMGGMLGGLLAGSLLGSLLFGGGFNGGGFLDIILIGGLLFLAFKFFSRRRAATQGAGQPNAGGFDSLRSTPGSDSTHQRTAAPQSGKGGFDWEALTTPSSGQQPLYQDEPKKPAGFDEEEFLRGAKAAYTRLNNAWDKRDLSDIAQFSTPAFQKEIQQQAAEDKTPGNTEIMLVNASLLFCVGAMAIMGALDSGLTGDHATLYAKSTLDGITSIVYGSTMGVGVALSGVAVFLYQGLITLCASFIAPFLSDVVIAEMKCVGSLLIIGLSFNMLGMTKIKVMNYVPAVFFPILLCTFM